MLENILACVLLYELLCMYILIRRFLQYTPNPYIYIYYKHTHTHIMSVHLYQTAVKEANAIRKVVEQYVQREDAQVRVNNKN